MSILKHFPKELGEARQQQVEALKYIEQSFSNGMNTVIVEAPTGSGKSGLALTLSRAYGGGHVCTFRVALQSQYTEEFERCAPLLGRSRYACLKLDNHAYKTIPIIHKGEVPPRPPLEKSCAVGPCMNKPRAKQEKIRAECSAIGGCPVTHAIDKCCESETVVSNLHSLLYNVSLNEKVPKKPLLILDESHGLANALRDFAKVKIRVRRKVDDVEVRHLKTTTQWLQWLNLPLQLGCLPNEDARDSYKSRLEKLEKLGDTVQKYWYEHQTGYLLVEITPIYINNFAQSMLFALADKVVMLSGTFFNKEMVTRPLGVDLEKTAFKQIPSDFPKENRPVYLPKHKDLDLSFKGWAQNLPRTAQEIRRIMDKHPNEKGLIHVNSYKASRELEEALGSDRIISHVSEDFALQLQAFYDTEEPKVFISPTAGEGYSFDDDYARFQCIVTVAYPATSDPYIKWMLEQNLWGLYNYETLKILMQAFGRVVRSREDRGASYLIDGRFYGFLKKTWSLIPRWAQESFRHEIT
jgi:ATP-dependent DNA helicase DinG